MLVSRTRLIAVAMQNSEILECSFSITLLSRLSSGDSLLWVMKWVRGVSCDFSWLALEPVVGTRTLDCVEASSKFWVHQPGSGVAESEQSLGHLSKSNLVWELYF